MGGSSVGQRGSANGCGKPCQDNGSVLRLLYDGCTLGSFTKTSLNCTLEIGESYNM